MSQFWKFAQLSEKYKTQKAMDQIPQVGQLFVGGLKALDAPDHLDHAKITHILSMLEFDYCDFEEFGKYHRLWIQVEDHPKENLLQHFRSTNTFLDTALAGSGSVLVHCAMGVSRSATVACAYLMHKQSLSPAQALDRLREGRPTCAPNEGFMEQLHIYDHMLKAPSEADAENIYTEWLHTKNQDISKI